MLKQQLPLLQLCNLHHQLPRMGIDLSPRHEPTSCCGGDCMLRRLLC